MLPQNEEWRQWQNQQDEEHLRLLALFYRIYGGIVLLGICLFGFYIFMGSMIAMAPHTPKNTPEDAAFAQAMFSIIGFTGILVVCIVSAFCFAAASWIQQRQKWTGVIAMAAILCLNAPLGTALGVFTIVVLTRPTVRALFGNS